MLQIFPSSSGRQFCKSWISVTKHVATFFRGFHSHDSHGGTPQGMFISWKIRHENGWFRGSPILGNPQKYRSTRGGVSNGKVRLQPCHISLIYHDLPIKNGSFFHMLNDQIVHIFRKSKKNIWLCQEVDVVDVHLDPQPKSSGPWSSQPTASPGRTAV